MLAGPHVAAIEAAQREALGQIYQAERETPFQNRILRLCKTLGLLAYHTHDSRRSASGFPDLVIPTPPVLRLWELKAMDGQPSAEQYEWLEQLQRCDRVDAALLRPDDWAYVVDVLSGQAGA